MGIGDIGRKGEKALLEGYYSKEMGRGGNDRKVEAKRK